MVSAWRSASAVHPRDGAARGVRRDQRPFFRTAGVRVPTLLVAFHRRSHRQFRGGSEYVHRVAVQLFRTAFFPVRHSGGTLVHAWFDRRLSSAMVVVLLHLPSRDIESRDESVSNG